MTDRTITLSVPEAVFRRAQETAVASSLSVEDIFTQSIGRLLPPLEDDLPQNLRAELAVLILKSDEQLHAIASAVVDRNSQDRLEALATALEKRPLTTDEQAELERLMDLSYRVMLLKAEAFRLLALRGYEIFPQLNLESS